MNRTALWQRLQREQLRHLDLFSGIGGFALGLEATGHFETVGFCESDAFCRIEALNRHWPGIPVYRDVRQVNGRTAGHLGPVDLITGGFPCQDISAANHNGAGIDGARSGLVFELLRIIGELRPRWVIAENVPWLRTRGYDRVHDELAALGYTPRAFVVGARHLGAPHERDRVWIVADANQPRQSPRRVKRGAIPETKQSDTVTVGCESGFTHPDSESLWHEPGRGSGSNGAGAAKSGNNAHPNRDGQSRLPEHGQVGGGEGAAVLDGEPWGEWNGGPSAHLRLADGLPTRVARQHIRGFGNAIVPQIATLIGQAIVAVEETT